MKRRHGVSGRSVLGLLGAAALGFLLERQSSQSSAMVTADSLDFQRGVQNEPLTEQELKLISRLFSDPTVFPRDFKKWVTDHSSDTVDISKSQVHGLINSQGSVILSAQNWEQLGAAFCPMIVPYPSQTAPKGWMPCDGTSYKEVDYPTLFGFIGHDFDVAGRPAPPSGEFRIPDLQGRAIWGYDPVAAGQWLPFAANEGSQPGGRGPWHCHTYEDVEMRWNGSVKLQGPSYDYFWYQPQAITKNTSSGPGGNTTIRTVPSHLALNYIIASGKMPTG